MRSQHTKSQPQGFDTYSIFYDQGEYRDPTFINSSDPWPGDRTDRYKLVYYYGQRLGMTDSDDFDFTPAWDFYDLEKDPKENHNAYNDKEYAPIIKKMKEEMLRLCSEAGDEFPQMTE